MQPTNDLGEQPEDDDTTEADRLNKLADQLAWTYDYTRLAELEKDDPQRAQEHRDAAHELHAWLTGAPREERRAAFSRGWERAKERRNERAERRISELEDLLASHSPDSDRTPSRTAMSWAKARQDPRFELVLREAMALDRYDGTSVIPRPLDELLAARVMTAIHAHEAAPPTGCAECDHPQAQHAEADEPVSVGQCRQCAAEPDGEDNSWHDYEPQEHG